MSSVNPICYYALERGKRRREDSILGMVEWIPLNRTEARVTQVYVAAGFRRLGIAFTLLSQALQDMRALGYQSVRALVRPDNVAGDTFFESQDFQLVLRSKGGLNLRIRALTYPRLLEPRFERTPHP